MKAKIEIAFEVDGECPPENVLLSGLWELIKPTGYIGSEMVDGTDDWGIEVGETVVTIDKGSSDTPANATESTPQATNSPQAGKG